MKNVDSSSTQLEYSNILLKFDGLKLSLTQLNTITSLVELSSTQLHVDPTAIICGLFHKTYWTTTISHVCFCKITSIYAKFKNMDLTKLKC